MGISRETSAFLLASHIHHTSDIPGRTRGRKGSVTFSLALLGIALFVASASALFGPPA